MSESLATSSDAPRLAIVIVNFRTPGLTIDCLRSLEAEIADLGAGATRVVVVDNGSGDGSPDCIAAAIADHHWTSWCELLACERNGGFAWGNNRGLERVPDAACVLLLNSDTLVHSGALRHCLAVMDAEPDVGVMSCRLANADGSVQNVARRFPTPARLILGAFVLTWLWPSAFGWAEIEDKTWDRDRERRDVDWLGGAFLMIRGDLLRRIGGLDEDFFFYGEDIEFSHRVMRAGYRRLYDPAVTITHLGGASSDPAKLSAQARNVHAWRGRYLVLRKCHGALAAALVRIVDVLTYGVRLLVRTLIGRGGDRRSADLRAIFWMLVRPLRTQS